MLFSTAQESEFESNRSGRRGNRRSWGRGAVEGAQDQRASERSGARRDNAHGNNGGARARAPDQHHMAHGQKSPSGQRNSNNEFLTDQQRIQAQRRQGRGGGGGGGGGRAAGGTSQPEARDDTGTAAASPTPRSPRTAHSRSPTTNNPISLGKMSGFGPGDRGWSERVENRRQQQLAQRNRASASVVAEVNNDSGKIEPLTPTAPAASFDGHHQAVSPPRLRRLVHAEVCLHVGVWQGA